MHLRCAPQTLAADNKDLQHFLDYLKSDRSAHPDERTCWMCEQIFPRLIQDGVCADCRTCPPGGNDGYQRAQGKGDFEAVREIVEALCADNVWMKQEQVPHISDYIAHLAAASYATAAHCEQTPEGYTFLKCGFPHPNGNKRERTKIAKEVVEALGTKKSHQIFWIIVWRFHNTKEAWEALRPLLQQFRDDEDIGALRAAVKATYETLGKKRSHLLSTGDAIRTSGGHASWRAAVAPWSGGGLQPSVPLLS